MSVAVFITRYIIYYTSSRVIGQIIIGFYKHRNDIKSKKHSDKLIDAGFFIWIPLVGDIFIICYLLWLAALCLTSPQKLGEVIANKIEERTIIAKAKDNISLDQAGALTIADSRPGHITIKDLP